MHSDKQIFVLQHDAYLLFLLERVLYHGGLTNPIRICRDRMEAHCFLSGQGPYADRGAHPLPGLFILDLELPNGEALSILRWARSAESLDRIAIVGTGSRMRSANIQEAFDHGMNAFFSVPDELDQVALFINTLELVEPGESANRRSVSVPRGLDHSSGRWHLRLYSNERCARAAETLWRLCEKHLPGDYQLELVDLALNPKDMPDEVIANPTLVRRSPTPVRAIIGDLNQTERLLLSLDIDSPPG